MDEQIPFLRWSKKSWERGELCSFLHARTTNSSFIDKPREEVRKAIKMLAGGDICAFPAVCAGPVLSAPTHMAAPPFPNPPVVGVSQNGIPSSYTGPPLPSAGLQFAPVSGPVFTGQYQLSTGFIGDALTGGAVNVINSINLDFTREEYEHFANELFLAILTEGLSEIRLGAGALTLAGQAPLATGVRAGCRRFLTTESFFAGDTATETYFRTMSPANYEQLLNTGRIPATGETFISPSLQYAQQYNGITVQFSVQAGTTDSLLGMGVRNVGLSGGPYNSLPVLQSGWGASSAFFKLEGQIGGQPLVNIGLGQGSALNTFNNNIINFNFIPSP